MAARLHHSENTQQYKPRLIEEWVLLPQDILHQLVLSMRRRCEATIARVDLEKKLLVSGNKNESKILPSSPVLVSTSAVSATASTVSVKLSTYEEKTNWEVYKTQFSIISEAIGRTEGIKACELAASLRGEAAEILQTLPLTDRLNLNSLYNALDLRFG
ncbi:uncharacterized protein TNCV_5122471 [Trichonephila clavipes]|nr:uncharacterized protein TNCV_5122471 [Trichonephila clavipes]